MSKNAKNARNLERARNFAKMHLDGSKGPSKTTPLHGKRWGYRDNPDVAKRKAEQMKLSQVANEKTSKTKILEGAGAASK